MSCRLGRCPRSRRRSTHSLRRLTRERLGSDESFVAVLEVCGFNDWLIRMLRDYRCHKVILIQPEERKRAEDRSARRCGAERTAVGQPATPAGRQACSRPSASRYFFHQRSRKPTTHDAPQRCQPSTNSPDQHDQTHAPASQPPMGDANQDVSHSTGHCLAEAVGVARDRPAGDESLAHRS